MSGPLKPVVESVKGTIKNVVSHVYHKFHGLKLKLMDVDVMDVDIAEESESLRQLIQEDDEETDDDSEDESNMDDLQSDRIVVEDNSDTTDDEKDLGMKVSIGGVLHNNEDAPPKDEFVRLPAEIKDAGKDLFLLHVPGVRENGEVAAVVSQGASDLMPPDMAKVFIGSDRVSSKK